MRDITKLKEVIQKAVPSILELKFGCRLLDETHQFFGQPDPVVCVIADEWANEEYESHWIDYYREHSCKFTNAEIRQKFKILGRPIRLADVLHAVSDAYHTRILREDLEHKSLWEWAGEISCKYWNLLDDNLDNQSDECINFLTDLLLNNQQKGEE